MIEKNINGVKFFEFELFSELSWLKAAFSSRIGGVSSGPFSSMNFRQKGDTKENITENYKRFCSAAALSFEGITFAYQEHGINVKALTASDKGKGFHKERDYTDIDGILSNESGILLTTFHADCASVFLVDPQNRAIGLAHAGWRGSAGKIAEAAVLEMVRHYGSKPENMLAAIGPSICYSCFEVDKPVASEFDEFDSFVNLKPNTEDKYIIDLKGINRHILAEAGLSKTNIEVSALCTKCDASLFYSHRRDGDLRGSMAAFMEITYDK